MVAELLAKQSNRNVVRVRITSSALSRPSAIRGISNNSGMHIHANVAELVNAAVLKIVDSLEKGLGVQIPPLAFDYGRLGNVIYIDFDEYLQSLCSALQEVEERLSDFNQELQKLSDLALLTEPMPQYPFVREIGNMRYCKGICRKPIHKARSCC